MPQPREWLSDRFWPPPNVRLAVLLREGERPTAHSAAARNGRSATRAAGASPTQLRSATQRSGEAPYGEAFSPERQLPGARRKDEALGMHRDRTELRDPILGQVPCSGWSEQ